MQNRQHKTVKCSLPKDSDDFFYNNFDKSICFVCVFFFLTGQDSCPQDWVMVSDTTCVQFNDQYKLTWSQAQQTCNNFAATLIRFASNSDVVSLLSPVWHVSSHLMQCFLSQISTLSHTYSFLSSFFSPTSSISSLSYFSDFFDHFSGVCTVLTSVEEFLFLNQNWLQNISNINFLLYFSLIIKSSKCKIVLY